MKKTIKQLAIISFLLFAAAQFVSAAGRDFYQIQVYRLNSKAQEARTDNFLKMAYLPALHRAGIKTAGVFKPIASDTISGNQIIVWLPITSLDQLDKLQSTLSKDAVYQTAGADFLNAPYDNAPFQRKESILLKAFPEAPAFFINYQHGCFIHRNDIFRDNYFFANKLCRFIIICLH